MLYMSVGKFTLINQLTYINRTKMKKIEYMAPEMEVVKMSVAKIICTSETASQGGEGDPDGDLD